MGRQSTYTQEKAELICERLAAGESLNSICKDESYPAESTVRAWALDNVEGFAAKYARARQLGYDHHGELILKLADESRVGVKRTTKANGDTEEVEGDMVDRSRLQVDARKWLLSKMLPKVYGERTTLAGDPDAPLNGTISLSAETARLLAELSTGPSDASGKATVPD